MPVCLFTWTFALCLISFWLIISVIFPPSVAGSSVLLFQQLSSVSCDLTIQDQNWLDFYLFIYFYLLYLPRLFCLTTSRGQSKSIVLYCFPTVSSPSIIQQIHLLCVLFCSVQFVDLLSLWQIGATQQYTFTPLSL